MRTGKLATSVVAAVAFLAGILGGPIMEDLGGMGSTSASGSSSGKTRGFGLNLF